MSYTLACNSCNIQTTSTRATRIHSGSSLDGPPRDICLNCQNTVHVPVPHDVRIPEMRMSSLVLPLKSTYFLKDITTMMTLMNWWTGSLEHEHVESASRCSESDNACTSDEDYTNGKCSLLVHTCKFWETMTHARWIVITGSVVSKGRPLK